jgi:hypothetical protein
MNYETNFQIGRKVKVAERYLSDEASAHIDTSPIATVIAHPSDSEELVGIVYENGEIDYVPQDILTVIYIIEDWAGNHIFREDTFDSYEEAWEYIYENVDNSLYNKTGDDNDSVYQEYYVLPQKEKHLYK